MAQHRCVDRKTTVNLQADRLKMSAISWSHPAGFPNARLSKSALRPSALKPLLSRAKEVPASTELPAYENTQHIQYIRHATTVLHIHIYIYILYNYIFNYLFTCVYIYCISISISIYIYISVGVCLCVCVSVSVRMYILYIYRGNMFTDIKQTQTETKSNYHCWPSRAWRAILESGCIFHDVTNSAWKFCEIIPTSFIYIYIYI